MSRGRRNNNNNNSGGNGQKKASGSGKTDLRAQLQQKAVPAKSVFDRLTITVPSQQGKAQRIISSARSGQQQQQQQQPGSARARAPRPPPGPVDRESLPPFLVRIGQGKSVKEAVEGEVKEGYAWGDDLLVDVVRRAGLEGAKVAVFRPSNGDWVQTERRDDDTLKGAGFIAGSIIVVNP
jgi:hypothetical protein